MNFMQLYSQFIQNPIGMLAKKFNIPQTISDPNDILNYLVSSGQVNQQQINQAMSMRDNPIIQQLLGKK